jgi:L-phenylalanine/L-methionine N-acetyltransferase
MRARKRTGGVFALWNAIGIALYKKFGFEVEGTHRRLAFRDGEYVDAYSMARLKP